MVKRQNRTRKSVAGRAAKFASVLTLAGGATLFLTLTAVMWAQSTATDPGVRGIQWCNTPTPCQNTVGTFQPTLTSQEIASEPAATTQFETGAVVACNPNGSNVTGCGLGPRFNGNSCSSCHAEPVTGGSSPSGLSAGQCKSPCSQNPLFQVYLGDGTDTFVNTMPSFETLNGPVLIPRFPYVSNTTTPNGLVQQLFVIGGTGSSYPNCPITQPNFTQAAAQDNLVFRQPLPTFGDGYIDFIENKDILNNLNSNLPLKTSLGIGGVANIVADGSVARFGWKAQWRAILPAILAEEKVEEGISNELKPTEIDQTTGCVINPVPEDATNYSYLETSQTPWFFLANAERDAIFVRFLSAPVSPSTQSSGSGGLGAAGCPDSANNGSSCSNGQTYFNSIGCVLCHTTSYSTPPASIPSQGHTTLNLFSDLLLHHMGSCLADNITQGSAQGDMWRTPPLWDAGQRLSFMHDARTTSIVTAIEDHSDQYCTGGLSGNPSYPASEADAVIKAFNNLSTVSGVDGTAQQDLVNFLRSL